MNEIVSPLADETGAVARVETRAADARLLAEESAEPKHGRVYELEELWENFEYFMRAVVPVATGSARARHPSVSLMWGPPYKKGRAPWMRSTPYRGSGLNSPCAY